MNKREFLKTGLLGFVGFISLPALAGKRTGHRLTPRDFKPSALPYAYNALEPFIDKNTLQKHHANLYADYTNNFNTALHEQGITVSTAREIFENASRYNNAVVENGGGYFNNKIFWPMLSPKRGSKPSDDLSAAINSSFGSFEAFKDKFSLAAKALNNSGWTWLIKQNRQLKVTSTLYQNNPFMNTLPAGDRGYPILCIDLWDHASGPKYKNRKDDYVDAFWNFVNWENVNRRFKKAKS